MKKQLYACLLILICSTRLYSQTAPSIEWQKSLGGSNWDDAYSIQQTTDGGFIVAGYSESNNGDVTSNQGWDDYWIVKLNSFGNIQWQKSFGGSEIDDARSIQQTTDGGYIVTGYSFSNDGDVTDHHGTYSDDYWIVKLDSLGNIQWQKSLGGSDYDQSFSIQQTSNKEYVVAGYSGSSNGYVSGNHGEDDYWLVKLDSSGNPIGKKCFGGSSDDLSWSIQQTTDDGFIVAGTSESNDGDVTGNHGDRDYWIVKLDSSGNIQWQKSLGGSLWDYAYSIQQTTDAGFIVAGTSNSNDGDVTGWHAGYNEYGDPYTDYWIVKIDSLGNMQWQKSLGGSGNDGAASIRQTSDGGFIVAGYSYSNDGDVLVHYGLTVYSDEWIVKLDSLGNIQWQKSLGGSFWDDASSIQQTTDGGFIVAGTSYSNDGDVSGHHGGDDYWIVKLSNDIPLASPSVAASKIFSLSPNPASTTLQIHFTSNTIATLSIINTLGEKMKEKKVSGVDATMDVSNLPAGTYLATATTNGKRVWREKVIVVH